MSKFYTEISKYYDYIFPLSQVKLNLIKEIAGKPPKNILDVASANGSYSRELSKQGYNVTAIDLDESMIKLLRKTDPNIESHVMNMLDIEKLNKKYDLIFCIGNSLVHLENNNEILKFLVSSKKLLNPNGSILIQIINYDRVLEKNVNALPSITNDEVNLTFERYYDYLEEKHKINFKTILKVDDKELINEVLLNPVRPKELEEMLKETGFKDINSYGNFKKDPFVPMESMSLVIIAKI